MLRFCGSSLSSLYVKPILQQSYTTLRSEMRRFMVYGYSREVEENDRSNRLRKTFFLVINPFKGENTSSCIYCEVVFAKTAYQFAKDVCLFNLLCVVRENGVIRHCSNV